MANIQLGTGIHIPTQIPLDPKGYVKNYADLIDLGVNNIKAFSYYEDLFLYCVETHKTYIWREELEPNEAEGHLAQSYTYPAGSIVDGIDYSDRIFNIFESSNTSIINNDTVIENGDGTYTWVQYGEDINGLNMVNVLTEDTDYIGIAYNQTSPTASDDPADYTWSLITGINSYIVDGITYYTWIKYSASLDSFASMQDTPDNMLYMGISVGNLSSTESDDFNDYEWHPINGVSYSQEQNNRVRVINIAVQDITQVTEQDIANYINENLLNIQEDENIIFKIIPAEDIVVKPDELDENILLELTAEVTGVDTATLDWNPNGDIALTSYTVTYQNTVTGAIIIVPVNNVLTLDLTGLDPIIYSAYVTGYDANGTAKQSNTVLFTLFVDNATPFLEVTGITDTTVSLAWSIDSAFEHDRFELFQVGVGKIYDTTDVNDLNTQVTGLIEDTSYQFYVIAYNGVSASNQSNTVTIQTLVTVAPPLTAPILTYVHSLFTAIKFSIQIPPLEVPSIVGFNVAYRILGFTTWQYRNTDESLVKIFGELTPDTTYEIRVQSLDINNITISDWSNIITATTAADNGLQISMTAIENTPTSADFTIVNGLPFQELRINFSAAFFVNGVWQWWGHCYLQTLGVNGMYGASYGTPLPTEWHDIVLDANGEYHDRFVLGVEYDNEADMVGVINSNPTWSYSGGVEVYDFNTDGTPYQGSANFVAPN